MRKIIVHDELGDLEQQLAESNAYEDEIHNERKEELDWIVDQLCKMSDENFKEFIRSIKYQRKADSRRRRMTPNA